MADSPDPEAYTVGIICALSVEKVAACSFLDEEHPRLRSQSDKDSNDYTLGRISGHNVVIAGLPLGRYGTTNAAIVARDMVRTFPSIRIGLMVGIGGGAPSKHHDIRLGDVVVGASTNGKNELLQYDFGKTIQERTFQRIETRNNTPLLLQNAVGGIQTDYIRKGHQLQESIQDVLRANKRIRRQYKKPDADSDILYQSSYLHRDELGRTCVEICGNKPEHVVMRPTVADSGEDGSDDDDIPRDDPTIHYGLIASANQLMKDAEIRDSLAKEFGILCFEMEAAGLQDHFPCLIIRGICDYSDTHKNKEWQGYAAMTAAAYAKDVLCHITPNRVIAEKRIADVVLSVKEDVREIHRNLQDAAFEQRGEKIERWLSPPDPSTNYNQALQQRQKGTGLWFLQSHVYNQWKTQPNSALWLYGIPGCGKTVLSSTIIEDLEKTFPSAILLYFYFDFSDDRKQKLDNMLRSLVSQLYWKSKNARKQLDLLFSSCTDRKHQPTHESLYQIFLRMIDSLEHVYIVLDALDECSTRAGPRTQGLLSWISDLLGSERKNVQFLATSRPEHDIQSTLTSVVNEDCRIPIQSDLTRDDINAYIHTRVRKGDGLKRWRKQQDVQEEIEAALIQKTNGMFRWAACQIDALESCLDYITLESALTSLPKTLDETYHRILQAIPSEHKRYATILLQLITYSEKPITIEEAVDAIAVRTDKQPYFLPKHRMPDPQEISRYCSSLVIAISIKKSSQDEIENRIELQLAHFSVKEYFLSDRLDDDIARNFQERYAGAAISKVCLAYLLQFDESILQMDILRWYPFAKYSATYWLINAARAKDTDNETLQLIEQFFDSSNGSYQICYGLHRPDQPWYEAYQANDSVAPALYYAALGGLLHIVKWLLDRGADLNAQGGYYENPLQAASYKGHEQIMRLLVEKGADVNAQGGFYGNALQAASSEGHEQIVKQGFEIGLCTSTW